MPLSAVLQEGPEKALCGTVKAARWQQDNIGVRLRSMTSHKIRLWHEVHIRTALKGPRSSWKSSVVNSCHWFVCHFQASKQSTSSSEMDFLKIAWRSSLVTSRWTLSVCFRHFCGPFFRFFFGGGSRQQYTDISVYWHTETWGHQYTGALKRPVLHCHGT